jgi:hypothetical protein
MRFWIVLRIDSAGACPLILSDDSAPLTRMEGVRYRLVAQTDDHGDAVRVTELLQRRCQSGELAD